MNAKMVSNNSIAFYSVPARCSVTRSLSALSNDSRRLLVENVDDLLRTAIYDGV